MAGRVGMEGVRALMARYLEDDRDRRSVIVEARSVEEALRDAGIQLELPVKRLEFEVLDRGVDGPLGLGAKPWRIRAYETSAKREAEAEVAGDSAGGIVEALPEEEKDRDGECYVRLGSDGALLKVTAPRGRGRRVSERVAFDRIQARAVRDVNEELVRDTVKRAEGEYVRVGDFIANPANDAFLTVDVFDQEMRASVLMTQPGPGGADLSKDAILAFLRNNKVVYGIDPDKVQELEDKPRYREAIVVAEGDKPYNGKDSTVKFNFETDRTKLNMKETADGRVDFKELGLIQNVVAGQPLARKVPPEPGRPGRTVTGKMLPARNGKDVPLPIGKNVRVADDGQTLLAEINGQVTYLNGKINVEEIFLVPGDVNLKTGNIMFLGTVVVAGSVEDGFRIKASGNVEIKGNVGKADIYAEGDVIVHQGVTGKGGGSIRAGKSVWAKFIENATIEAGDSVIASDGLVNSQISANKRIICHGKRASIVGGRYRACEEINAKTLGSPVGGAETIVEVGYDPRSKERMDQLAKQAEQLRKQIDEFEKNIQTLVALKKARKTLPEDKEAVLRDHLARREELVAEVRNIVRETESIQSYLANLKAKGRISSSGKVYPGVKIVIKDIHEEIKVEQKGLTFYLDNMLIRTTKYEEVDEELLKRGPPDAYQAD